MNSYTVRLTIEADNMSDAVAQVFSALDETRVNYTQFWVTQEEK